MDDIVVIILTLIILIIGIVGKTKRKNIQQPAGNQSSRPNILWGFLDDLEQTPEQENVEIIEGPVKIKEKPVEEPSWKVTANEEGGTMLRNRVFKEEKKQDEPKPGENKKEERFSLRKAVIYSEILNRKYT